MAKRAEMEQHIAVFGESGSGKTVLLSSFYGPWQEGEGLDSSEFHLVAENTGQGNTLLGQYLGMRKSSTLPDSTKFRAHTYSFLLKAKGFSLPDGPEVKPFDAVRLVWHDYPGEWFEQEVSGEEEATRRVDAFRALMSSDVAFVLVDGERLADHNGEEERYLKGLFGNFRNTLLTLKDDILVEDTPLDDFPRIWVIALSKADVLPDLDIVAFRELLVEKAHSELSELERVLKGFVSGPLSLGEDFVLLSSAKFEPGRIDTNQRIGLDLILPIASILPMERHLRWAKMKELPIKVLDALYLDIEDVVRIIDEIPVRGKWAVAKRVASGAMRLVVDTVRPRTDTERAKGEFLKEKLTGFRNDLQRGRRDRVLHTGVE